MPARTKRKRQKLPLRFRIFGWTVLIALLLAAGYIFLSLPIWRIAEISVGGTEMLVPNEIRDLSGVPLGDNLFFSSLARTRDNLRKITAIKEFHLYRIPPGTVLINVKERKPIAVLVLKSKSAVIDADGYVLNRNPSLTLNVPNMTELPVISGLGTGEYGGEEQVDPQAAQLIVEIVSELANLLGSRRLQLATGGFDKISFSLDDILLVKVGRNEGVRRKMDVFKSLLPEIEGRWDRVAYVDVRYPDNPVIRFK